MRVVTVPKITLIFKDDTVMEFEGNLYKVSDLAYKIMTNKTGRGKLIVAQNKEEKDIFRKLGNLEKVTIEY